MCINTLHLLMQGQRLKKLQARRLREEKEEQEKVKIDQDEMEYQAKCREEAIQRAKTLLYQQTDRVKTFHVREWASGCTCTCICMVHTCTYMY